LIGDAFGFLDPLYSSGVLLALKSGELAADAEDFARRQPTWFVLGAVATGFVVGRLLWTSTGGRRHDAARSSWSGEPTRTVRAAVSSGSGTAAGELSGNPHPITGAVESR